MTFCKKCGTKQADGYAFCTKCGTALNPVTEDYHRAGATESIPPAGAGSWGTSGYASTPFTASATAPAAAAGAAGAKLPNAVNTRNALVGIALATVLGLGAIGVMAAGPQTSLGNPQPAAQTQVSQHSKSATAKSATAKSTAAKPSKQQGESAQPAGKTYVTNHYYNDYTKTYNDTRSFSDNSETKTTTNIDNSTTVNQKSETNTQISQNQDIDYTDVDVSYEDNSTDVDVNYEDNSVDNADGRGYTGYCNHGDVWSVDYDDRDDYVYNAALEMFTTVDFEEGNAVYRGTTLDTYLADGCSIEGFDYWNAVDDEQAMWMAQEVAIDADDDKANYTVEVAYDVLLDDAGEDVQSNVAKLSFHLNDDGQIELVDVHNV